MDMKTLAPADAKAAVTAMETVAELRKAATDLGIKFSGNTGEGTLRKKIMDFLDTMPDEVAPPTEPEVPEMAPIRSADDVLGGADDIPIQEHVAVPKKKGPPSLAELETMDPTKIKDVTLRRQVVRAKALKLTRVKITNLDPSDAQLSGGIVTIINQYTGKVSKYVPYGEESEGGYHLPEMILSHLRSQQFALRKEKKGGQFGVKQYKTTMVRKFAIEVMPDLTASELSDLAKRQAATQAIDS